MFLRGGDAAVDDPGAPRSGGDETAESSAVELLPLRAEGGDAPRFVDEAGREVLLRGVNVNSLGEYHQADPDLPSTLPVTEADWRSMASLGFSAVRLIVSWSRLEPEPGEFDEDYVAEIHEAVGQAAAKGIYVILDMHQDAWSPFIATPADHECPDGLERAIGWDGAPEWATLTDGAETCRSPGSRESSEAVQTAFRSFYDNRMPEGTKVGIRTALARTWGRLAAEFADESAVAGYDLFNEPNGVEALEVQLPKYTAFVRESIAAIRAAEQQAGGFDHIVFVEPIVSYPLPNSVPAAGFDADDNLAFAPHHYWESITDVLTVEQGFRIAEDASAELGMPFWVGEYGWWSTSEQDMEELGRYAAAEDAAVAGGAWWQWRQACGDPHSIGVPGNEPTDQHHLNALGCPDDDDLGITEPYSVVLSRTYPRAAPGRITALASDPERRTATISGESTEQEGELLVWVPDGGHGAPDTTGAGLTDIDLTAVEGGWVLSATVTCVGYTLMIDTPGDPSTTAPSDGTC
ncbi:MAG: glycoside hydrolase family 5 protein [Microthrixaceae bacterium]|nr:glycoside hydrolase family 5 protein [Microthrixaceae bacterium]